MGTPHNEAQEGDIAKTVLMPGDPTILTGLRAPSLQSGGDTRFKVAFFPESGILSPAYGSSA